MVLLKQKSYNCLIFRLLMYFNIEISGDKETRIEHLSAILAIVKEIFAI